MARLRADSIAVDGLPRSLEDIRSAPKWHGDGALGAGAGESNGPAPVAGDDVFAGPESQPLVLRPLDNDQGEGLTITHVAGVAIAVGQTVTLAGVGAVTLNADQTLTFTPVTELDGRQTFTYTVRDAAGLSDTGTVHVDLAGQSAGVTLSVSTGVNAWLETQVRANPTDARVQQQGSVGALEAGGHVVTWVSGYGYEDTPTVHAQRFTAAGAAVGGVINVGSGAANPNTATLGLADGGFLVVWQDSAGLKAQFYTAAGATAGSAILLESASFMSTSTALTAIQTADGDIIVAYSGFSVDGASGQGVAARRLSADRQLEGDRFIVSAATAGSQVQPHIAEAPDGGFMAVWLESDGVHARAFDADGVGGPASLVQGSTARDALVTVLNDGTAVVVWNVVRSSSRDVWARRLDADGQPVGEAFLIAAATQTPSVNLIALPDGGFAVAFNVSNTTATVRRYDANGVAVSGAATTGGNLVGPDALAVNEAGELVVLTTMGTWPPDLGFRRLELPNAFETTEDVAVAFTLVMNQVDPNERGQLLIEGLPAGSVLSAGVLQEDGSWLLERAQLAGLTLTPPADFAGLMQVTATAFTDGDLAHGARRTFAVEVTPVNDAPRTTADVVAASEDQVVTFSPLANDREVEGEAMTITHINGQAVTAGQSVAIAGVGSLTLNADGTVTFTPTAHWSGQQAFTYTVRDASGLSSTGSGVLRLDGVTDGGSFSYGQLASWTPVALDAADARVNTTTTGVQNQSSVAALAGGGYLITWVSAGQDGSGTGVYAQRYDSDGQKVGGEFRVNHLTTGDQQHTAILAMEDGGWVIAWSGPVEGGSTTAVYARRYDADGDVIQTHLVSDAAFNTQYYSGAAYNQGAPTLAAGADGGFVIGWTTFYSATDTDIWLRQYGADGTLLGGHWVEAGSTLEDHLAVVAGANGQTFAIHQEVDGYYNGPTSGWDRDYGIYLERHGLGGALGDPIQLNTVIAGNQTNPTLAVLANGNMVAAWQSPDASGTGITFRVLNADGEPILAERRANQTTAGNQSSPGIVALADGTFVILWTSAGQDGSGAGVYGQRISADGTLYLGGEFRLNATTAGDQTLDSAITDASFAVLEDGTLVATWWGDGEVHHRRFDPPEAAFTAYQGEDIAIPLTVSLVDASETFELAISNLPPGAVLSAGTQREDGSWVVTGAEAASLSLTPPPGYAGDILLRIEITTIDGDSRSTAVSYRAVQVLPVDNDADGAEVDFRTGTDPTTTEDVPVTEVIGGLYQDAGVAALDGGGHVVVWSGNFGDSDGWGVRAKVYGADGSVVSVNDVWGGPGDFTVNTYKTGTQNLPTVLALGDGGFAVFWHSFSQDGSEVGLYGQRFNATGQKLGGEFRVNTTTALAQEAPSATLLSDGGFVVLFESEPVNDAGFQIRGQRYDASGAPVGSEFLVRDKAGSSQRWPDVTALEDGGFVAVWNSFVSDGSGTALEMRIYDDRNDATVYRLNQNTLGSQTEVKVVTLADGSFLAVWTTLADQPGAANTIQARLFEVAEDGTLVGHDEVGVFGAGGGAIGHPDVVALPDGGYVILAQWDQPGDAGYDIFAQRFDAEGRRVGSAFRINETTYGDQLSVDLYADPMVTVDANGDLLVVWTDLEDGNIYRRTFDIDPAPPFIGEAGLPITLAIAVEARDASETVEIVLSNLPAGAVLSAGVQQADGSWLLAAGDLAGLTLTTPSSFTGSGFDLIVTVTTRQGADSFTTMAYQTVQVLPPPPGVVLDGSAGADALAGDRGGDTLAGMAGDDVLDGLAGDDLLTGGLGSDQLNGGAGQDTAAFAGDRAGYAIRQNLDGTFTVTGPDGTDTLTGVEFARFADRTERLFGEARTGTAGAEVLAGTAWGDVLSGLEGDDVLRGGAGADVLNGGAGIDTVDYSTAAAGVRAQLNTNVSTNDGDGGTDTFSSIENLTGSAFNDTLIGDAAVNVLSGGLGADVLLGLAGNDVIRGGDGVANTLHGGAGDDLYVLEANDSVVEAAGEGTDTVEARISAYGLANNVENLIFGGTGDFTGTGNAQANSITGGAGDDVLRGRGGADVLNGGAGIDTADYSLAAAAVRAQLNTSSSSNDGDGGTDTFSAIENLTGSGFNDLLVGDGGVNVLRGGLGSDTLLGLAGNDVLWGGTGASNALQGGLGDDRYILEANDSVVEAAGEGNDTIEARINAYVLAANVENLIFGGTGDFAATGNAQANAITGGAGNDNLRGRGGVDVLNGGAGIDTVDYTLAAAGVTARLDSMRATNDGDGGTDTFANVENLTGSLYNDLLIGNGGNNVLKGGIGTDTLLGFGGDDVLWGGSGGGNNQLQGGAGNDWYVLEAFDTVVELAGEGIDTVEARIGAYTMGANIENLFYVGGTGTFVGTGNALNNIITGGNGNDILRGRGGNDTINGGLGRDEIQMRGVAGEYTVTVEGNGYRIVDTVAGRDGSTFVTSIEVIRWANNATRTLTYPVAAASGDAPVKAGPEVSPVEADGLFDKDADPFVLPAPDDIAQVLPGPDGLEVLPALADRPWPGLEARLAHLPGDGDPGVAALNLRDEDGWLF